MTASSAPPGPRLARRSDRLLVVELLVVVVVVAADLLLPALVLLTLAGLSLAVRRERPASLGLVPLRHVARAAGSILGLTTAWTLLQLALLMPLAEHLSGRRQDVSMFAEVQGDVGLLALLLALSWTLGAVAEEVAFRGYVFSRALALFPSRWAPAAAALLAAVLFGLIHTEQGVVGVALTTLDGLFFAWLRVRYGSVWAPVLAHGMNNTIGLTAYFVVGPVYALW
jgi:CAAX protease family protein